MEIQGKIKLLKSNQVDSKGVAIAPLASELEFGQVAVNYSALNPSLFFKDTSGKVVKIVTEEIIAYTLANILGASASELSTLKELLDAFAASDIATTQSVILSDLQKVKGNKVDKKDGYGLSQNNYSTVDKLKLAGIENGAQVNNITADATADAEDWQGVTVDSALSTNSKNPIANNAVASEFGKLTKHIVLTEMEYEAISNKDANTLYYIID